jgi:RNA polymerase sigma-70 factor (ECF subfamily)
VSSADSEPDWVREARSGSAHAFGQLVRLHQQALRAFLRRLCANPAQADDLAQDSFVFAWEHIDRFDPARPFRPWLFGIAWRKNRQSRRGLLRLLRRETAHAERQEAVAHSDPGLALDLAAAIATLAPEPRAVLLLCLGLDFTHGEAAEALSLPLGTVKSHIARGRQKLAAFLGDEA